MLALGLDLVALALLPLVCLSCLIWSARAAKGRPTRRPQGANASPEPPAAPGTGAWITEEAARGIRRLEAYMTRATPHRRPRE